MNSEPLTRRDVRYLAALVEHRNVKRAAPMAGVKPASFRRYCYQRLYPKIGVGSALEAAMWACRSAFARLPKRPAYAPGEASND